MAMLLGLIWMTLQITACNKRQKCADVLLLQCSKSFLMAPRVVLGEIHSWGYINNNYILLL